MQLAPLQRADMDARHAAAVPVAADGPQPMNVQPVLELGDMVFFMFRGKPYGVPPVPWKAGQRMQLLWAEARAAGTLSTPDVHTRYYAAIAQLPALVWQLCFPTHPLRRALRKLGLLRNPFEQATEQELVETAAFLLTRRMKSTISLHPAAVRPPRASTS